MATIDRIYDITDKWFVQSPYFATFLLSFTYIDNESFPRIDVPTIAVAAQGEKSRPTIVYNEDFCSSLSDKELEGVLYHEILHLTSLNSERRDGRDPKIWNIATDAVNNEDILNTAIGGEYLVLPKGGVRMKQMEDEGYTGLYIAEYVADFIENLREDSPATVVTSVGDDSQNGGGGSGSGEKDSESGEDTSDGGGGKDEDKESGSSQSNGPVVLQPVDDHRLLDEIMSDPEAMEQIEQIMEEARSKSWGSHKGGGVIQIDNFHRKKPKVDPRAIIHRQVVNYMFSNYGEYRYTWSRRNRRGFPLPGKRRAEDEVLVFLDVSGSTFDQITLSKFFNEIDYLASRGVNIRLLTFDVILREELKYSQRLWKNHNFMGGGGTYPQPLFDYLRNKGKIKQPTLIFTDGMFDWRALRFYGAKPFWVFSETIEEKSEFLGTSIPKATSGRYVVLGEE